MARVPSAVASPNAITGEVVSLVDFAVVYLKIFAPRATHQ